MSRRQEWNTLNEIWVLPAMPYAAGAQQALERDKKSSSLTDQFSQKSSAAGVQQAVEKDKNSPSPTDQSSQKSSFGLRDMDDYWQAKRSSDMNAAYRIVENAFNPDYLRAADTFLIDLEKKDIHNPILVACYKPGGKNALPIMAAQYLGTRLGLEVEKRIIEIGSSQKTGTDKSNCMTRLTSGARYAGPLKLSGHYIGVDDTMVTGGTIGDLGTFINGRGGNFVGAFCLASPTAQPERLDLQPCSYKQLYATYQGDVLEWLQRTLGFSLQSLTDGEARYLLKPDVSKAVRAAFRSCQASGGSFNYAPES